MTDDDDANGAINPVDITDLDEVGVVEADWSEEPGTAPAGHNGG